MQDTPKSPPDPDLYRKQIEQALKALRKKKLNIHIAPQDGLYRRRPKSHFHAAPELFFQTGGASDFECPGGAFRLEEGEACVMPRGVPHAEKPVNVRTPHGIMVYMHRSVGFIAHHASASPAGELIGRNWTHIASPRGRDAFRYLEEIARAEHVTARHRKRYIEGFLEVFLITLFEELRHPETNSEAQSTLVADAEKLVRMHISDPEFSVTRLAAMVRVSADHLSRQFRLERGMPLKTWIILERIEVAKSLLMDPRYNIGEIGWACGFNSPSYFIRVFERKNGVTPRAFRLAHTPNQDPR